MQHLAHQNVDVVIVPQSAMLISQTQQIADSALAKRLPTVYGYREHVVDDGLISYGVDSPDSVSKKGVCERLRGGNSGRAPPIVRRTGS